MVILLLLMTDTGPGQLTVHYDIIMNLNVQTERLFSKLFALIIDTLWLDFVLVTRVGHEYTDAIICMFLNNGLRKHHD